MSVPILAIAYVLVAALLLNLWLATRWHTGIKLALIAVVTLLYLGTYSGLREIQGWPSEDPLPQSFRLLWAKIDEPNKSRGTEGQIYLWVQELDPGLGIAGEPRAYRLPFRLDLAEQVEQAMNSTEAGAQMNGRMTRAPINPMEDEDPLAASQAVDAAGADPIGTGDRRLILEFSKMPRTALPPKAVE
jgi:hypothetical protein